MAKRLLVKTPKTSNGKNLLYDENKQPIYTTSILMPEAKVYLERLNSRLPGQLKHEFQIIDVEEETQGISNSELKARLLQLEKLDEKAGLEARIAELEAKLALKNTTSEKEVVETTVEDENTGDGAGSEEVADDKKVKKITKVAPPKTK